MNKATATLIWFRMNAEYAPKILLTQRSALCKTFPGWYAVVGGSVEDGECAIDGAIREVWEETGLSRPRNEYFLLDCYTEETFKCFIFELHLSTDFFIQIKNTEPEKHSPWTLYSIEDALKLPKLMPAIEEILLTKQKIYSKLKQSNLT